MIALWSATSTNPALRNTYVPPRQAWNQGPGRNSPRMPSPLNTAARPAELPDRGSPASPRVPAAGEYYEDVDPRFAAPPTARRPTTPPTQATTNPYEDIPQGSRSPAESEHSTFTSISQRGINPRWNPPPPPPLAQGYGANVPPRRPVNRSADVVLGSNPDFDLPARGTQRTNGASVPDSAYPGASL